MTYCLPDGYGLSRSLGVAGVRPCWRERHVKAA